MPVYHDVNTRYDWPVKEPLSICQSGWKEIRNTLLVIRCVNLGLRHRLENSSNTGYIAEEEINVIAKKSTLVPTCSTFLLFTSGYQYKWSSCLPITPETDALLPKCWMLCSLTNLGIAFPSNFGSSYKCLILWRNYNVVSYKLTEMIYGCLWLWII